MPQLGKVSEMNPENVYILKYYGQVYLAKQSNIEFLELNFIEPHAIVYVGILCNNIR